MGTETLEFTASAIVDSHGAYVGPMITCQVLTSQTRLVARFEDSVGAIADAVGESAETMKQAATAMTEAVTDSGHRLRAVTGASEQASSSVSAAAAGAEELAMSVAEIARAVQQAATGTNEVNDNIVVVDRAVAHTGTQSDQVLDAATRLSEQSDTLKSKVRDFLTAIREAA